MKPGGPAIEDLVTIFGFVCAILMIVGLHVYRSLLANSPGARMRRRLHEVVSAVAMSHVAAPGDTATIRQSNQETVSLLAQLLAGMRKQAEHMGGIKALRLIGALAGLSAVAAAISLLWLGMPLWVVLVAMPAAAAMGGMIAFRVQVKRYQSQFLAGFPDALDLIIRAVRAGVPVVQAIVTAGRDLPYPVGHEFHLIGSGLRLGLDQEEVMEAAAARINLSDFRFFTVCLQLQRETGGPLADTLENLAGIIRARREVRLKTRALTAQGRMSSQIIAMVPFGTMAALQSMGDDYLDVLFTTDTGQKVLWVAMTMVVVGLTIIFRMSKLED